MVQKNLKILLLVTSAVILLFLIIPKNFLPNVHQKSSKNKNLYLLQNVAELIRDYYVETPNPTKTMKGAFRGLIGPLDPLSSYLDPQSANKYKTLSSTTFQEPGIVVLKKFGTYPVVIGIKDDSPAENAGIKVGDALSEMDGQPLLMLSMLETNLYLKNTEGGPANLKILRQEASEEMTVERKILQHTLFTYTQSQMTSGILKIHKLYPPCTDEVQKDVIITLKSQTQPLIIDMRNCHEGEIEEALDFTNLFLQTDEAGYLQDKEGKKENLSCLKEPVAQDLPLILWTNAATVGPAEVVAGLFKKFRRAQIIGIKTPGLVAKQEFFTLEDGSGLLLTSKIYYLPDGKEMWEKGIEPDEKIPEKEQSTEQYLEQTSKQIQKNNS
jgi:carboxyl-terminal processing protease